MFKIPTLFILSITSTFGISIGTWNVENNPNNETEDANFNVTIELIGEFGILGLNETDLGSSARLLNLVNTFHNTNAYQIILSEPVFYDRVALMYDTRQVTLLESTEVDNFLLTRPFLYGLFRPNGTAGSMDFYVLTTHLKSGDTIEVQNTRALEAAVIQNEIDSLPPNSRIILAGDLNMQSSNQTAWSILTGGTNRLQDVAQAEGNWKDNEAFKHLHTQDPGSYMDDRFDIILSSENLQDSFQLETPQSSYTVIGNNGSHWLNYYLKTGSSLPQAQIEALAAASDHLPVMIDLIYIPEVKIKELTAQQATLSWKGLPGTQYQIFEKSSLNQLTAWEHTKNHIQEKMNTETLVPRNNQNSQFWQLQF